MQTINVAVFATFKTRAFALIIDTALCLAVAAAATTVVDDVFVGALAGFGTSLLYFGECEGQFGQTLGKRFLLIRVVDETTGERIGVRRALLRHLVRLVSYAVLGLGFVAMLDDPRRQTWHDKVAHSVVR